MAQSAVREYDAKKMFAQFLGQTYHGYLIHHEADMESFLLSCCDHSKRFVIKPDQLFGKRGKYGLVGVGLDALGVRDWWSEHFQKEMTINGHTGRLHTFLIEPFVLHDIEYYVAIQSERDRDIMYFSSLGGVDIEENWDHIQTLQIPLLATGDSFLSDTIRTLSGIQDDRVYDFLASLYSFFTTYGFTYLELNPFTVDPDGNIIALDMVSRLDTCAAYRQASRWGDLEFTHPFGEEKNPVEQYIEKLDAETGASLKLRIINPRGRIWLMTSGGGASVVIADALAQRGWIGEIGNYGECSGNPDRDNTRAYADALIRTMLANDLSHQYLVIAGAIANFTRIDTTFAGIIDALEQHQISLRERSVHILVRRGGVNDREGLILMQKACDRLGLPCEIGDGDMYMTDILDFIVLK